MSSGTNEPGQPGDGEKKGTNLYAMFGPHIVETAELGQLSIPLRTGGFLVWYDKGNNSDKWTGDGERFVRDLLAEQARQEGDDEKKPLGKERIATLDSAAIEHVAAAIVATVGSTLIRSNPETEPDQEQTPASDQTETASAHLQAMVDAYYQHHKAAMQKIFDTLLKNDSLTALKRALAQTSPFQLETDKLRSTFASATAASRFLEDRPLLAQFELPGARAFLEQQEVIARSIAPLQTITATLAIGERFKPLISQRLHDEIIGSRLAWAKTVATGFHLRPSEELVARMRARSAAADAVARFMADTRFDQLGFQTTANLALDGLIAPGAASDILRRYDEDSSLHGAIFDEVLEAVRSVDADEAAADPEAAAERAWHAIASTLCAKMPHLDVAAWIALASLLVSVITAIIAYEALQEQRRSDRSPRLESIHTEITRWHSEAKAQRDMDREASRYIRYVHEICVLRTDPDRSGAVIRLVYPDQLLRVIEVKGNWALVEVFDYGSDAPLGGWIGRRNLRLRPAN